MMSVKSNLEASVQIQSLLGALHDLEPVIFFFFSLWDLEQVISCMALSELFILSGTFSTK